MAINSSGSVSLGGSTAGQSIALELGLSATGAITLNDAGVRDLAGIASGAIVLPTNFWGASSIVNALIYYIGADYKGAAGDGTDTNVHKWAYCCTDPYPVAACCCRFTSLTSAGGKNYASQAKIGITCDNTMFSWGSCNASGELMQGNCNAYRVPTQVGSETTWCRAAALGWDTCIGVSYVVKSNGRSYGAGSMCFGWQGRGVSWQGEAGCATLRDLMHCDGNPMYYKGNVKDVFLSAGAGASMVLLTNGDMYATHNAAGGAGGTNYAYGLTNGFLKVAGSYDWLEGWFGNNNAGYFLRDNGEVYGAGSSGGGQLGRNVNSAANISSPVYITNGFKTIRAGRSNAFGIKCNGTLWGWGSGNNYTLGNHNINYSSPIQIGSATNWDRFNSGTMDNSYSAIKCDNTLWAWGTNLYVFEDKSNYNLLSNPTQVHVDLTNCLSGITDWKLNAQDGVYIMTDQ